MDPFLVFPDPPPALLAQTLDLAGYDWKAVANVSVATANEPADGWAGAVIVAQRNVSDWIRTENLTFFGPDKPYIRDRVNAYEQLLESWGGVPDHLKADFGRWLRQSDEAHKAHAAEVGISLDTGPGAARAAFGQMDPDTLCERGIIIAGDPESCIRGVRLYEEAGVDQVISIMQTEIIPHERALSSIEMFGQHVIPACRAESRAKPVAAGV